MTTTHKRISIHRFAVQEIKQFIHREGLSAGSVLPSEALLAQRLGISRPSLREGLKSLEAVGVLQSRHGNGVYVSDFSFDAIVENLPYSMMSGRLQLRQLLEVREALEVGMVAQIVERIAPQDLAELSALTDLMMAKAERGESYAEEDRRFHLTLFRCINNPFLNQLVDLFWRMFQHMAHLLPESKPSSGVQTAQEHRQIVQRLTEKDTAALVSAHRRHFAGVRSKVFDGVGDPAAQEGAVGCAVDGSV